MTESKRKDAESAKDFAEKHGISMMWQGMTSTPFKFKYLITSALFSAISASRRFAESYFDASALHMATMPGF